ncbi:MAG TPA: alpha/beta fold hydrolase, partial [Steroidobacteraceae bacterium]|nr:alpha/beta fold hydrolase [Steroidobacteraceae bacterium]
MKVKANGIDINYEIEGNGPWLTMSHSLACNLHMWDPQMLVLTKKFKVLRYDTRGHGQSSAPAGEYTLEQLADDVKGLLDALKIRQTHWAGLSMGGMIGQAFALKYPGVFQSMVLADTTSRRPPDAAKMWGERIQNAQQKGMDALVEGTLGRWFTEPYRASHKDVMARIGNDIRTTPVAGFVGCCHAIA